MTQFNITATQARRLAILKQRLAGPRPQPTPDGIVDLIRDLGCVQIDPIRAVERTQYLVLWSRLGNYDPADLDKVLWEDKRLFEYWAHAASIVLTENFQIHSSQMAVAHSGSGKWDQQTRRWLRKNDELRKRVIDTLKENPPLSAAQIQPPDSTRRKPGRPGGWGTATDASRLLSRLWQRGEVVVAGRNGLRRFWTLTDRWLPDWTPREPLSEREIVRRAAQISLKALGVGTPVHIRKHFVRGHYDGLDDVLADLESEGRIARVNVEGDGGLWPGEWYVHEDDVSLLERLDDNWSPRTVLLSPFDNLICDRARTLAMWDFDFTIEIYVPMAQRKFGYYVMPILQGDRLVGRIDPKMDRATGTLMVNATYAEPHAQDDPKAAEAIAHSVEELARFLGARRVKYGRRKPLAWRPYLRPSKVYSTQS